MRIATWNLWWAKPGTDRHRRCIDHLESLNADVVVTTEDSIHDWPAYPHRIDGGDDWGYPVVEGRRKVIAWSRTPWSNVEAGESSSTAGRLVSGSTTIGELGLRVVGVCIPWSGSHVSSGRCDQGMWDDHIAFCGELGQLLAETPGPTIVAGDFNQRIPRGRQPVRAAAALDAALGSMEVASAGERDVGWLIDHVALGPEFSVIEVEAWSNVIDGQRLSDHSGVVVSFSSSSDSCRKGVPAATGWEHLHGGIGGANVAATGNGLIAGNSQAGLTTLELLESVFRWTG